MTDLIEIAPNRWRFVRETAPPARSDLPCPHVITDTMPPTEQVDGRFYESKAAFRAKGRELGLTEVGNEKPKPKQRAFASRSVAKARREALERAVAQYKEGRRPSTIKYEI
jgi:hypothetical protein